MDCVEERCEMPTQVRQWFEPPDFPGDEEKTAAYELLSFVPYLRPALDISYGHHGKWDGTGYPRGLRGEAIPLAARIFVVVDV
jgi:hypothetical protein